VVSKKVSLGVITYLTLILWFDLIIIDLDDVSSLIQEELGRGTNSFNKHANDYTHWELKEGMNGSRFPIIVVNGKIY